MNFPASIPAGRPRRPWPIAVVVGLGVGFAALAIAFAIVAIPWFALARFAEPGKGLDRPAVRSGLLNWALPIGVVCGVLTSVAVARWYRRGGRLPSQPSNWAER